MTTAVQPSMPVKVHPVRERFPFLHLLRKDVELNGPTWLPVELVLGAIAAVAYADHVVSISLVYLYILPLGLLAISLRRSSSCCVIVACVLLHDYDSPRKIHPGLRILDNLTTVLCFTFVVYFIQRYIEQREA